MKRSPLKKKSTIAGLPAVEYWNKVKRKSFEKNKGKVKKWKRPAPVGERLKVDRAIYSVLSKDYLRDHPICECGRPECEKKEATEIHHKRGRGRFLNVVEYFLAVSRKCHNWIGDHSKEAMALGLVLRRNEKFINPKSIEMNKDPKEGVAEEQPQSENVQDTTASAPTASEGAESPEDNGAGASDQP
jgi:hypothetical protein